jgi:response regulator of citrate/malate metabolism
LLERFDPEFALCDVRMSDIDGLSFLEMVRQLRPDVDVVRMTAFDDMETVASAMRGGAVDFLVKPIGLKQPSPSPIASRDRQMRCRAARQSPTPARPGIHWSDAIRG